MHIISLISSLALFWMLLSGHTDGLLVSLGVISCLLTTWLCGRMDIVDHESHPGAMYRHMPRYWFLLAIDTLKSNWQTAQSVVGIRPVEPITGYVATPLKQDLVKATLANSITITPGTLTLDVQKDRMLVHALSPYFLDDLRDGEMVERCKTLDQVC